MERARFFPLFFSRRNNTSMAWHVSSRIHVLDIRKKNKDQFTCCCLFVYEREEEDDDEEYKNRKVKCMRDKNHDSFDDIITAREKLCPEVWKEKLHFDE